MRSHPMVLAALLAVTAPCATRGQQAPAAVAQGSAAAATRATSGAREAPPVAAPGSSPAAPARSTGQRPPFLLVIHGGAGTIRRAELTPAQDSAYRERLTAALRAGYEVLSGGGPALDAVVAAIRIMEDSPLFNAGKGAVFTSAGTIELDASIMDGRTLQAGAVAAVKHVRNPIEAARLVMEKSPHVLLMGEGAETFLRTQGVHMVPQSYFFTRKRWESLKRAQEKEKATGQPVIGLAPAPVTGAAGPSYLHDYGSRHGTVGAVALDSAGNLAAGTSTGGRNNKRFGRVGDSPIIGAGTYASNRSCAVSGTGDGEYFIRNVTAREICARVEHLHEPVEQAARAVIEQMRVQGGEAGVIVLDGQGHFAIEFNSDGMFRGRIGPDGKGVVDLYRD